MITRILTQTLKNSLKILPAVALTGPRQIGKTTLALSIADEGEAIYLDLEDPIGLARARLIQNLREEQPKRLIVIDEVQRLPEFFSLLRGIIDSERRRGNKAGLFLLLGSASMALLRQSAESLAGRISYLELTGINALEWAEHTNAPLTSLWLRGGFPDSLLASNDDDSMAWRRAFIRTYLERDMPQLGPRIPTSTLDRFWQMLAHGQGAVFNGAQYARSLDVSVPTVSRYLDFMVDLLLVRRLQPWTFNATKRLVRSPKVYVRDSGITHALAGIGSFDALLGHPLMGGTWEGFVIENIMSVVRDRAMPYFYRTANGAELDLVLEFSPTERWAIEIKYAPLPKLGKGFYVAINDIAPTRIFVVTSGPEEYLLADGIRCISLPGLLHLLNQN
jgi:predicted AAA+ superfamily ATPase